MDSHKLIDDTIKIDSINKDGKVFERVSRIQATSKVNKLAIELDVNTEIYPVEKDAFYKMVLASSVNADGSDTFDVIRYENEGSESGMGSLIDKYEYVMHGKVFKYQLKNDDKHM
jgi:DNA-directed RNA polymerases I, II, and III subunit RPABC3